MPEQHHPIPLVREETEIEWSAKLQKALLQKQGLRFTAAI